MIKKMLIIGFAAITLVGTVAGCNTTKGAGEDLESAGEAIQDTAEDMKP